MAMTRAFSANLNWMDSVRTGRLRMEPAGTAHGDAERIGADALGKKLKAKIPSTWPPEVAEPPKPEHGAEWVMLYVVHKPEDDEETVIGVAGMARWPEESHTMQFGGTLLREWQRDGLGAEMTVALADWAMQQPGVLRIVSDIPAEHHAAAKCLRKAGYSPTGEATGAGFVRWERKKRLLADRM
jgi:RimJ/RimL family protein N-acetyltransferase